MPIDISYWLFPKWKWKTMVMRDLHLACSVLHAVFAPNHLKLSNSYLQRWLICWGVSEGNILENNSSLQRLRGKLSRRLTLWFPVEVAKHSGNDSNRRGRVSVAVQYFLGWKWEKIVCSHEANIFRIHTEVLISNWSSRLNPSTWASGTGRKRPECRWWGGRMRWGCGPLTASTVWSPVSTAAQKKKQRTEIKLTLTLKKILIIQTHLTLCEHSRIKYTSVDTSYWKHMVKIPDILLIRGHGVLQFDLYDLSFNEHKMT